MPDKYNQESRKKNVDNSSPFVRESEETTTGMCVCVCMRTSKNKPARPMTKTAKLCCRDEVLRANSIFSILENSTSAKLKFLLLTGRRTDIAFLMYWVSLTQAAKVQAYEEVV